ncbi:MAG: glycoside hydrolase family 5 protein [Treponema sp.]|nr:glycoside hydrolase family 5 protein [Treponema sp.]
MKKIICLGLMFLSFSACFAKVKTVFDKAKAVKDTGSVAMTQTDANEFVLAMGAGWNLGNTLDATGVRGMSAETSWGMPKTTQQMIKGLSYAGIKTIRIPVSWSGHVIDQKYTVDPAWMNRVKEIVDWAIAEGMNVILNIHHDNFAGQKGLTAGRGYYPNEENYKLSEEYFANIWTQIALAFNNGYDEHLIFETMNEPRLRGTNVEWSYSSTNEETKAAQEILNKLNKVSLDAIRATKGNNAKRFVMIPGYCATPNSVLSDEFLLPKDKIPGRLLISVHMYTPYIFAGQAPGATEFTTRMAYEFAGTFKKLNEKFVQNGVGVVIGEYGAVNKNNLDQRIAYFTSYLKQAKKYNLAAVLWDNGQWKIKEGSKDYGEKFGFYNRKEQTWYFPEILDVIVKESN